ncbi:MAG: hypothetical protein HC868_03345, partial [Sphingomonadales bacterium]|nr:hypothetical protein [Sphingomonadales bacterium]
CPPGPYERVSMVAHYLKTKKPKSKILILDAKENFSKQGLFMGGWKALYDGMIEWVPLAKDGKVVKVDPKTKQLECELGAKHKGDVVNIVPPQRAGAIAMAAGVNQGDWCPINPENFSSRKVQNIYVLGDASIATEMPKSAFSANSQAKVVAADIVAALAKKDKFEPRFRNTCWSLLAPDDSVKIGANYAPKDGKLDPSGSFVSQRGEAADVRKQNYQESTAWYANITAEMFAKAAPAAAAKKAR